MWEHMKWGKTMNNEDNTNTLSEAEKDLEILVEELLKAEHQELEEEASQEQVRDSKTVVCKECSEKIHLVCNGTYPNGIKKWTSEDGKIANGKLCPSCNTKRAKSTMKRSRAKSK